MKKIIFNGKDQQTIELGSVPTETPIFAKKDGMLYGMVIREDKGWILKVGGSFGSHGHNTSRHDLIAFGAKKFGYEYFVEA